MTGQAFLPFPVPAVIAVLVENGETLLVRRANPPDAGLWGFPGGKIEYGETVEAAAIRELFEETGVRGEAREVVTALDVLVHAETGELQQHYILVAVRCRWLSGLPLAADDALEAGWFPVDGLDQGCMAMSAGVGEIARRAEALALEESARNADGSA